MVDFWFASCFSPQRAGKATGAEIPEKWRKITKFPSPVRPPKMGKIARIKGQYYSESALYVIFQYFFPSCGGRTGEGNFVIFLHFSGISSPGGSPGPLRGKQLVTFGGKFCQFSPGKIGSKSVTENFTTFFTSRKEICHLELTLGESSPDLQREQKRHIRKNHIKYLKKPWAAGCPGRCPGKNASSSIFLPW